MDVDIVCVGFGPATAAFLTTLTDAMAAHPDDRAWQSRVAPGMPLQVMCYERADDLAFGVSGVVTAGRHIRARFRELDPGQIPMAASVCQEKVVYLMDPVGASRRSAALKAADTLLRASDWVAPVRDHALELPWTPGFLHKQGGWVMSLGQFLQWVGAKVMASGTVQVWPATPVAEAVIEGPSVRGVRLLDQGVDKCGKPGPGHLPGMEIRAGLTVVGDGPVGSVGQQLDRHFGLPAGHHQRDWAVGMKMVVDLPEGVDLRPGAVFHTFGFPEPEIFGFLYVHPDRVASLGIFVPSWFDSPMRTAYLYLQHWMQHPYLWRYLRGGRLRSWGAKTLQESGRRGEPHLVGDGYARIGEGSGSTNVLTGSGVDEAWATGEILAESVIELLRAGLPFSRDHLERSYLRRRRESSLDAESKAAERSRDGFHYGVIPGLIGMALSGLSGGRLAIPGRSREPYQRIPSLEDYYRGRLTSAEIEAIQADCRAKGIPSHGVLMERCGWPEIPYDGQLLVSHQDALLMGGKVQAAPGYADHVAFVYPELCQSCGTRLCIEACSGQALAPGPAGVPAFDREKCVHCGACFWNCATPAHGESGPSNLLFRAGAGGLHSSEN
jgi:electron-transferring-flavoprotein dehydrogenase